MATPTLNLGTLGSERHVSPEVNLWRSVIATAVNDLLINTDYVQPREPVTESKVNKAVQTQVNAIAIREEALDFFLDIPSLRALCELANLNSDSLVAIAEQGEDALVAHFKQCKGFDT